MWGDGIDFLAVSMHALFGGGIVEVAESDLLPLRNGSLDSVYTDVDALVYGFCAAVDVQMPFRQRGVSGSDKGRQPVDQLLAFSQRDEPCRLHRVDEEPNLRGFKVTGRHMVEVLSPAVFDNIHTELHKLFDVVAERARVGGDAVLLQMGGDIRKRDRVRFVRGCTEVFEQDKRAIDMRQAFLLVYRFLLCLP